MATEIYLKRNLRGFEPASSIDHEAMQSIPLGTEVRGVMTRPRSVPQHRLFFKMLSLVADNTDDYHSAEDLLTAIKLHLRMVDHIKVIGQGSTHIIPRSISFSKMDQTEFQAFFKSAVEVICSEIIPGLDSKELETAAQELLAA